MYWVLCVLARALLCTIPLLLETVHYNYTIVACVLLMAVAMRLVYLYQTHTSEQKASINTKLTVTWNRLRPYHIVSLCFATLALVQERYQLASTIGAADLLVSVILHS